MMVGYRAAALLAVSVRLGRWSRSGAVGGRVAYRLARGVAVCTVVVATIGLVGCGASLPETLAIGAPAPAFTLPGADGRSHTLADYASSPVLAVVFTCNHCPASALYEQRIQQIHRDYASRGVAVVAINPDSPKTVPLRELAYSDVPDTLAGMTARAAHRRLEYAYLYDGETQAVAAAYKVVATPQVFVFDQDRLLRYVGRIDDSLQPERVRTQDARAAIDALLAHTPVRAATTAVEGCPIRWLGRATDVAAERTELASAAVALHIAGPPELRTLRSNGSATLSLVNFWATWCPPCIGEFPELQTIYRTYRSRGLSMNTVSIDVPEARPGVMKLLNEQHASSANWLFASDDTGGLQNAFDPAMPAAVPFTLLIARNGDVVHQQAGEVDMTLLRRAILANLPDDAASPGLQAYWAQP